MTGLPEHVLVVLLLMELGKRVSERLDEMIELSLEEDLGFSRH